MMNCRNGREYLREAIDSVFAQSYANWEIIFWDNASTDDSEAIARSYGEKVRYFKGETAIALGQARNLAMAEARGEYLAFLDCDDLWLKQKLSKQVALMMERKEIDFIYSNYYRVIMPKARDLILGLHGRQPEGKVFGSFLAHYPANLQTVMVRMDAIKRLNLKFDDSLELSEEFDFFMRILLKSKAAYINEPLATYRIHQHMSSQKLQHRYLVELDYIKDKFSKIEDFNTNEYRNAFRHFEANVGYWCAKVNMERGNSWLARLRLEPYKFINFKFFLLYLVAFLPIRVWKFIHHYKLQGKLH
ncbi:MAG: glycosyltransferase [Candidatus Omnitrophica bacterium]|nr:glycosyltransferase [Candidatus Omnitrophota bacterium]